MANEIYLKSWWGRGVCDNSVNWGLVYKEYAGCSAVPALLLTLQARATYYENVTCSTATLDELEAIPYTAPVLPTGLLADYPGASAAYSLRNLIDTTTNVVRVRRSSDNTEQDFTATEITDGTLTTFTGANDGFVATWYDQSNSGNNLSQVTAAFQPKLVSNGNLILSNNKPTVLFNQNYLNQNSILDFPEGEHFLVIETSSYPPNASINTGLYDYSASYFDTHYSWTTGTIYDDFASTTRKTLGTPPETLAKLNLYNVLSKPAEWSARLNSTEFFTTSSNIVGWGTNQVLGTTRIGFTPYYILGFVSEFIIYSSDQSLNRTGIETNINTEYTIY